MVKKLTIKQETFAQAYVELGNASEAYRRAYSTAKMKPETIWPNACRLASDSNVAARIQVLQAELAAKSSWTRERAANILIAIAENHEAKDPDKINSVKVLNTMHGFDAPEVGESSGNVTINFVDAVKHAG